MAARGPVPSLMYGAGDSLSPRSPGRSRAKWFLPFCFSCAALLLCVLVPDRVSLLQCQLGWTSRCLAVETREPAFDPQLVTQSCASGKSGGNVVLVTGAAGFIGFWASLKLKERGDAVIGLDNFNDYYPVSLKKSRAAELAAAGVHTVLGDVNNQALLERVLKICKPSHVLHLAAQAGVRYAAVKPVSYIDSNVRGSTVLFEAVKLQRPLPHVIYASSSSVYGRNERVPFEETDRVDTPESLYAATKRSCELLAGVYNSIYGISVTGLRFFTVYGPWGRPDMAALAFAHKIAQGVPVKIFKGPDDRELARDFTYIDDIIAGVLAAIDTAAPKQKRLYNLGNTSPHTVSEFVDGLQKAMRKDAIRHYVDLPRLGDVLQTHSNISAARQDLGYAPKVPLDEGLKRFVAWFYSYYGPSGRQLRADEVHYNPMR